MRSNVLELVDVERFYGAGDTRVDVLRGVELTIAEGQAVAVVGPSGSGKSTLLHVAGLLDRPDRGVVRVRSGGAMHVTGNLGDEAISAIRNRTFGFVYQFHHLLREFTALENVMMPALIGASGTKAGHEVEKRATELLKAVGLGHRLGHHPSQMSGGEQQRVAIARALMNKPALLLADEPTGNLDPHTADDVVNMLFTLVREEGLAAMIVTHNMALADRCDTALHMAEGILTGH